MKLTLICFY